MRGTLVLVLLGALVVSLAASCTEDPPRHHHGDEPASRAVAEDAPAPEAEAVAGERGRHVFEHPAMGTLWRVVLEVPEAEAARAEEASAAVFARIDALERVMSDYDPSSEVRGLDGAWRPLSRDLAAVLAAARAIAEETDGAFDVTVGPLSRLWRRALRRGELPESNQLDAARAAVGWEWLELSPDRDEARLVRPGARVDLGGIGKGFALDEGARLLRESFGIAVFLIDAGGDLVAGDPPAGESAWTVEVRGHAEPFRLRVARLAVTTSGDLHQHAVIDGVRYSHLIDPRTGTALHDGAAATVVCPSATTADALASAFCVLPDEQGRELARASAAQDSRSPFGALVSRADGTGWELGLDRWRPSSGEDDAPADR